jgi:NADH-quinone oxidoreductase subunit H
MLLGIGFKVILISTVLLGVLVPARARLLALANPGAELPAGPFATHAIVGLIRPLARLLDLIVIEARAKDLDTRMSNVAAVAVFAAPLSAFAVIPFGSRYLLAGRDVNLVVANLDWGIVWLLGAALISIYGSIGLAPSVGERVRDGVVKISYAAAAALSLAALAMAFGSLNPTAIAVAQDRSFSIGDFVGPALAVLQGTQLPGWGMFLQPISLLLYTVCGLGMLQTTAADAPGEPGQRLTGIQYLLVRTSDHLGSLLVASVVVSLFFGSGAVPFVSGATIIDEIAAYFGNGLATLLCMLVHTSVFFAKVLIVVVAIDPLRRSLNRLSFASSLNLCWKVMVPLALLNLFVTANFLLAEETLR